MRIHSIKTCTDPDSESVTGIQFIMSLNSYDRVDDFELKQNGNEYYGVLKYEDAADKDSRGNKLVEMNPIGLMTGNCDTIRLQEGLDEIKASLDTDNASMNIGYNIESY